MFIQVLDNDKHVICEIMINVLIHVILTNGCYRHNCLQNDKCAYIKL